MKYQIDTELSEEYRDESPWRSYSLTASGETLQDLLLDATIAEIDQDGGELNCYAIDEAGNSIQTEVYKIIEQTIAMKGLV